LSWGQRPVLRASRTVYYRSSGSLLDRNSGRIWTYVPDDRPFKRDRCTSRVARLLAIVKLICITPPTRLGSVLLQRTALAILPSEFPRVPSRPTFDHYFVSRYRTQPLSSLRVEISEESSLPPVNGKLAMRGATPILVPILPAGPRSGIVSPLHARGEERSLIAIATSLQQYQSRVEVTCANDAQHWSKNLSIRKL
jgi:hypothetical protein